jgi:hypothetical protein
MIGTELFGAQYEEVTTYGPAAFGDGNIVTDKYYAAPEEDRAYVGRLPRVPDMLATYAPSPADTGLDRLFGHRSVACLTGAPGTGRFTTACAALARRHGADQVNEILLPAGATPATLHRQADIVVKGQGHVLRLPGNDHVQMIRWLEDAFRRQGASLVLIRDANARDGGLHSAEVRHVRARPEDIFRCHLRQQLRDRGVPESNCSGGECVEQCLTVSLQIEYLQQVLEEAYRPKEIADMAEAVAAHRPQDEKAMEDALSASQPKRRNRATRILLPERSGEVLRHHRVGQYERAFRIAYAVFHRQPLHYVFESTGWLLQQLDDEASRPNLGRPALEHPVPELLGDVLGPDWADAQDEGGRFVPGTSRIALLRDPGMRGAILDVAWHEFDNTRQALLRWLDRLVQADDESMRRAAAEIAGLLAHHDFDQVHERLVDAWAKSAKPDIRQAAAWTAVTADLGGRVSHRVREKVREWVWNGMARQHDTAARVYASGLHQPYLGWTLADLRCISEDKMQRRSKVIAEAVNQLYEPGSAGQIVAELAQWTTTRAALTHVQAHAAWSLLALAPRTVDDSPDGWPELLARLASAEIELPDLAALWRVALLDPASAGRAWHLLDIWLHNSDEVNELRKPMAELVSLLAQDRPTRRRLTYYLPRMWEAAEAGLPEWIDLAMREL